MTAGKGAKLLRNREGSQQPTFMELFFDLVFVFALAQLSEGLIDKLQLTDALQTLVLLPAVWWVWTMTVWITDWFDPNRPAIHLLVIAIMLCSLVLSTAVPHAFGEQGLVFATLYVTIHIGRSLFFVLALRGHELQRRGLRVLFWFGVTAVPWMAGAFADGAARGVLWTSAVIAEYVAARLDFPTPGLGRSRTSEWRLAGDHVSERYRQFTLIALGDTILVSGRTFTAGGFHADRIAALVVVFTATVLLWRIYFYRPGELMTAAISASPDPARLGRSAA